MDDMMNGQTGQQDPQGAGEQPDAGDQPQAPAGSATPKFSPRLVEAYKRLVVAAMKVIFDQQTSQNLVQMMSQNKDNPPGAIAHAAMVVIAELQKQAQGLPPNFIYTITSNVLSMLAELGAAAGLFKNEPGIIGDAIKIMADLVKQGAGQEQPQQGAAQPGGAAQAGATPGQPAAQLGAPAAGQAQPGIIQQAMGG